MKFIIIGGNFTNKGAQAMVFVTISELRSRFHDCEIILSTDETISESYKFQTMNTYLGIRYKDSFIDNFKILVKNVAKKILGLKVYSLDQLRAIKTSISDADAFIDISGFGPSSQFGSVPTMVFCEYIQFARDYEIPYFVMPQSFGPFDYKDAQVKEALKKAMCYPICIFARESSGYALLKRELLIGENVTLSLDIVLQNKTINTDYICSTNIQQKNVTIMDNSVGIIPNARNYEKGGNKEQIILLYDFIIKELIKHGKNVYLLMHSLDDIDVCKEILEYSSSDSHIHLITEDIDCISFNDIVKQFDYIVASRYHAIIHAYKNSVPAIVLGWADKYKELLSKFQQDRFLFDVHDKISVEEIEEAISEMNAVYKQEAEIIMKKIKNYQNNNCFDSIEDYFAREN